MRGGGLRGAFFSGCYDPSSLFRQRAQRDAEPSSPRSQRIVEHTSAMSFPLCFRHRVLACRIPIPLRVQTGLVLGNSRTRLVVAGISRGSVLPSKAQACFMGSLQTLASLVLKSPPPLVFGFQRTVFPISI